MIPKTVEVGAELKQLLAQLSDRAGEAGVIFVGVLGAWDTDRDEADIVTSLPLVEKFACYGLVEFRTSAAGPELRGATPLTVELSKA